jgi:glycerophosphoryl diester phosphodiesterase
MIRSVLSAFLPALLMVMPLLQAGPLIVAHRGASADAPENTLPAFELAWKQGADAIEGDFRLTSDGHIVCIHDEDTKKVAGQKLVVHKSSLAKLRALDVGSWKDPRWKDTRIPTLPEVLRTVPQTGKIFIEIKCGPEIVPPLLKQLRASGLKPQQVVVIAFDDQVVRALKKATRDYQANWICSFKKRLGVTTPKRAAVIRTLAACQADGLSTNAWPAIDQAFIDAVRAAGCSYHVWTVDDVPTARRFMALGAKSITTNRPGALRRDLGNL